MPHDDDAITIRVPRSACGCSDVLQAFLLRLDSIQTAVETLARSQRAAFGTLSHQVTDMDAATQASLDDLLANVAIASTVETSIEALLTGLSDQIKLLAQSQSDPAVIAAIQQAAGLVAAVNARAQNAVLVNTPQTPPTP